MPYAQPQYNPLQPSYQGAPSWLNPSYAKGAQSGYNTNLPPGLMQRLSPQSTLQQIMAGFRPVQAQATDSLNNTLAAAGIVGGPAATAQSELQGQLAGSIAPTIANAIQTAQGNVLGAQEFQSGQGLQQALQNAQLRQGTGEFNAGEANQLGEFNVGNQIGANQFNASAANNAGSQLAQLLQGGWGQELQDFSGLNEAELQDLAGISEAGLQGMGNIAGGAAQDFQVQQPGDWSGLGYALGGMLPGASSPGNFMNAFSGGGFGWF